MPHPFVSMHWALASSMRLEFTAGTTQSDVYVYLFHLFFTHFITFARPDLFVPFQGRRCTRIVTRVTIFSDIGHLMYKFYTSLKHVTARQVIAKQNKTIPKKKTNKSKKGKNSKENSKSRGSRTYRIYTFRLKKLKGKNQLEAGVGGDEINRGK